MSTSEQHTKPEQESMGREESRSADSELSDESVVTEETFTDVSADGAPSEDAAEDDRVEPAAAYEETVGRLEAQVDELRNQLLRVHADFDNFRKRTRQEKEDLERFATRKLVLDLLPVVDNFERAMAAAAADAAGTEFTTGIEMVYRQLLGILERNGVTVLETQGQKFDPALHEAVMQEPADGREVGIVAAELQKGYMMHGRVLRPAMVKVTV